MSHTADDDARPPLAVKTASDWEAVAAPVDDFHDAVVREVSLSGEEYLDTDYGLKMTSEIGATATLLVHIQRRDIPAMTLAFANVRALRFDEPANFDPALCEDLGDGFMRFSIARISLEASSCEARTLGAEALGISTRLSQLLPENP